MSSENLWKPLVFDIFRWLNRNRTLVWYELTLNLNVLTSRIQQPMPGVHSWASSIFSVQRPESSVQLLRPEYRNSGLWTQELLELCASISLFLVLYFVSGTDNLHIRTFKLTQERGPDLWIFIRRSHYLPSVYYTELFSSGKQYM